LDSFSSFDLAQKRGENLLVFFGGDAMSCRNWYRRECALATLILLAMLSGLPTWASGEASDAARYRYYWLVELGPVDAEDNVGLLGDASGSFMLGFGFGHRLGRYFMGEAEFGISGREYSVPDSQLPDDPTFSVAWLSYSVAARFNVGRFEPFVAAGIGSGQASLDIASEGLAPPELEIDDDQGILFLYRVGFDAGLGTKNRVGLEFRRIDFNVDLDAYTGGDTNLGGTAVLFTYRYTFGHRKSTTSAATGSTIP
jgi:hypothetical protein